MERLDVIVRFHDMRKLDELDRCVYSLVTQDHASLVINLMTQRFSDKELQALGRALDPLLRLGSGIELKIWNFMRTEPQDARSELINLGIANSHGRYLAFLDCDDTIYPEAYGWLIERLTESGAAIAFGTVAVKTREVFEDLLLVKTKTHPHKRKGVIELLRDNFAPIHSYVIDRRKIDPADLHFVPALTKLEDYEFLIRLCAKYPSDFDLIGKDVGDYYVKSDGSNTTLNTFNNSDRLIAEWARARQVIEAGKAATVVSAAVQRALGIPLDPALTVAALLELYSEQPQPA